MKKNYIITLYGCDDYTKVEMPLTAEEHELIVRLSALTYETSTYDCMPRLEVIEGGN